MPECRSCHTPIQWAWTQKGKRIPLDAAPQENGNLEVIDQREGEPVVRVLCGQEATLPGLDVPDRFVSHFATCPNAASHRR